MFKPLFAHFLIALLLCAPSLHAAPNDDEANPLVIEHYEYFVLDAFRIASLRKQFAERGPLGPNGHSYSALTRAKIEARLTLDPSAAVCVMIDPRIRVEITTHLPRWQPSRTPEKGLTEQWPDIHRLLADHEDAHRRTMLAAADELLARLRAMPSMATCKIMEIEVERVRLRVLAKLAARNSLLDQATDFGRRRVPQPTD